MDDGVSKLMLHAPRGTLQINNLSKQLWVYMEDSWRTHRGLRPSWRCARDRMNSAAGAYVSAEASLLSSFVQDLKPSLNIYLGEAGEMAQLVKHLLCRPGALSSNPSTHLMVL